MNMVNKNEYFQKLVLSEGQDAFPTAHPRTSEKSQLSILLMFPSAPQR